MIFLVCIYLAAEIRTLPSESYCIVGGIGQLTSRKKKNRKQSQASMKISVPALALLATPATTAFHNNYAQQIQGLRPATALSVGSYLDALQESCDGDNRKPSSIGECAPAIASYVQAVSTGAEAPANNAQAGQTLAGYMDALAPAGPGSYSVGEAGAAASTSAAAALTGAPAAASSSNTATDPAAVTGYLHQVSSGLTPPPQSTQEVTSLLEAIAAGATTPRAAFPSSMAHEFSRARMGGSANGQGGMVGYESRRPYTYGRYAASGLNGMAGSANVLPAGGTRTALAATATPTAPVVPASTASAAAPTTTAQTFSSLYGPSSTTTPQTPSYPKAAHATSMSAEFARARSSQNTIGIESRKPAMYTSSISENPTLQAMVEEVCDADGPNSKACRSAIASYNQATETHAASMGQEFGRARTNQGTVGYESRKPTMYSGAITSNAMLSAMSLEEVCDADANSEACKSMMMAKYGEARAAWPGGMRQEFQRGRTAQGTVG